MQHSDKFFKQSTVGIIAFIIAFVQFSNALEYMIFTPLFSYMAPDFGVPVSFAGYANGMYTLAACLSGMTTFFWINQFNKKTVLVINLVLLGVVTLIVTHWVNIYALMLLRFIAGLLGGTVMGIGIALLINHTPDNRRAKMLAVVISAFSVASIAGTPAVIYVCNYFGWQSAFIVISAVLLIAALLVAFGVPDDSHVPKSTSRLLISKEVLSFASVTALAQFSPLLLIPVLVPIVTSVMHVRYQDLSLLFFVGGISGFLATRLAGMCVRHIGVTMLSAISTVLFAASLLMLFIDWQNAYVFMALYMGATYARIVAASVVAMQYPDDAHRAGFGGMQTAMTYLVTTMAFVLSAMLSTENIVSVHSIQMVVIVSACTAVFLPLCVWRLDKRLGQRRGVV